MAGRFDAEETLDLGAQEEAGGHPEELGPSSMTSLGLQVELRLGLFCFQEGRKELWSSLTNIVSLGGADILDLALEPSPLPQLEFALSPRLCSPKVLF